MFFEAVVVISCFIMFWVSIGTFFVGLASLVLYYGSMMLAYLISSFGGFILSGLFSVIGESVLIKAKQLLFRCATVATIFLFVSIATTLGVVVNK